MGGKPNKGTKPDKRLKANKGMAPKAKKGKAAFPGAVPFAKKGK